MAKAKPFDIAESIKVQADPGDVEPSRTGMGSVPAATPQPALPLTPAKKLEPAAPLPPPPMMEVEETFVFTSHGQKATYAKGDKLCIGAYKPGTFEDMKRQGAKLKDVV